MGKKCRWRHAALSTPSSCSADSDPFLIVNCTGLTARELVPDAKLYGTRGQLVHVNAPWIGAAVFGDEAMHTVGTWADADAGVGGGVFALPFRPALALRFLLADAAAAAPSTSPSLRCASRSRP